MGNVTSKPIPVNNSDLKIQNDWFQHADPLADFFWNNCVNRTDVWGGYIPQQHRNKGGKVVTKPRVTDRGNCFLTKDIIKRHFAATRPEHVIGIHTTSPENTSRFGVIEVDVHGPEGNPSANFKAILAWKKRLHDLGIESFITDSNGKGGFHLWIIFAEPVPTEKLYRFLQNLISDHKQYGLPDAPETFPKQAKIATKKYGNWMRAPGRHHTTDHYSKFWDDDHWLVGAEACIAILNQTINSPDTLPNIPEEGASQHAEEGESPMDCEGIERRILSYIKKVPNKTGGAGRSDEAYKIAAFIQKDLGQSEQTAFKWLQKWDLGNNPTLQSEGRLEEIIKNGAKYGKGGPQGVGGGSTNTTFTTNSNNEWVEPIPLNKTPHVLSFPQNIFPLWLESFVNQVARALEVPIELPGICAIVMLAICFQKRFTIRVNANYVEPLSIHAAVGQESGSRKSAVLKMFSVPLNRFESMERERLQPEIIDGERRRDLLLKQIASLQGKLASKINLSAQADLDSCYKDLDALKIPVSPMLTVGDITPEALAGMLANQKGRLAVVSAEGAFLEILQGRYNDTPAVEACLQGHAGELLKIHRASKEKPPILIDCPALSLLFCIQPCMIATFGKNATLAGKGLLSRIIFVLPVSTLGSRSHDKEPVPEDVIAEYHRRITEFLYLPENQNEVTGEIVAEEIQCEQIVRDDLRNFNRRLEPDLASGGRLRDQSGYLSGFAGKAGGLALRVAGLLALADGRRVILHEDFERGRQFTEFAISHALQVSGIVSEDPATTAAKRVLGWLKRKNCPHFTCRELHQDLRMKSSEQTGPLNLLVEHGFIRPIISNYAGGGRKALGPTAYDVNPLFLKEGGAC